MSLKWFLPSMSNKVSHIIFTFLLGPMKSQITALSQPCFNLCWRLCWCRHQQWPPHCPDNVGLCWESESILGLVAIGGGRGGPTLAVSLTVKYPLFWRLPMPLCQISCITDGLKDLRTVKWWSAIGLSTWERWCCKTLCHKSFFFGYGIKVRKKGILRQFEWNSSK